MLPRPSANMAEYEKIKGMRFALHPNCEKNYKQYLASAGEGWNTEICDYMPVKMDYEVSSRCNFRCTMCLMSEISTDRPPNMSFEDFKKSIDEQEGLVEVKLQGMGEPLLNPDFFQMVDYAVAEHLWVRTTINGSLLHLNDNYKKMIDSGIGEIQISVDGATKKTVESIRRGSDFDVVVENCRMLNTYAETKGQQWRTSCWMLVQKENVDEVEELLELAGYMKFTRLTYSIAISDWSRDNWTQVNGEKEVTDIFTDAFADKLIRRGKELGIEVTFWDGKDKYSYDETKKHICAWLFGRAYISADMRIVPCCVVCDSHTCDMGDANRFMDAWNADKYQEFRKLHMEGDIPKMCLNCYENGG